MKITCYPEIRKALVKATKYSSFSPVCHDQLLKIFLCKIKNSKFYLQENKRFILSSGPHNHVINCDGICMFILYNLSYFSDELGVFWKIHS